MRFQLNKEEIQHVWMDREVDGRVDDFGICGPCTQNLLEDDFDGRHWHDASELCGDCRTDFMAHALASDLFAFRRPLNGMLEDRVLSNDELESEPQGPVPEALDYFLQDRNRRDHHMPGGAERFSPGYRDRFVPSPSDRFRSGDGDRSLPGPYDGFIPGHGDRFVPGAGDPFVPE